jgi:hypothetical protein
MFFHAVVFLDLIFYLNHPKHAVLRNKKKKLGSRESGRKIKWQLFATTFFSMVAIYYSFQDSAGKLEASLGQRINEKDLVSTSAFRPAAGSLNSDAS